MKLLADLTSCVYEHLVGFNPSHNIRGNGWHAKQACKARGRVPCEGRGGEREGRRAAAKHGPPDRRDTGSLEAR